MIRVALIAFLMLPSVLQAADFTARPRYVNDGDTITISLRSKGIDTPEMKQRCRNAAGACYACGKAAKKALKALLGQGQVTVKVWETDRYGRPVVTLYADGRDAHLEMLRLGLAVAYRRYLPGALKRDYLAAEAEAKAARRGIWAGDFIQPYRWRKGERLAACERS